MARGPSCALSRFPVFGPFLRNDRVWNARRGNATAAKVDKKLFEKLPLAGIRVLDMTRVLAGVGRLPV